MMIKMIITYNNNDNDNGDNISILEAALLGVTIFYW